VEEPEPAWQTGELISRITRAGSFESAEFLRAVFDSVPAGVVVVDQQRRVRMTNAALQTALGLLDERLDGRRPSDLLDRLVGQTTHERCDKGDPCISCCADALALDALIRKQAQSRRVGIEIDTDGARRLLHTNLHAAPLSFGGDDLALVLIEDLGRLSALRRWMGQGGMCGMIGRDPKMLDLFETIRQVAQIDVSVLVEGESGSGKEMVAAALHRLSPRSDQRLVPVNCGALSPGLLESELFGHVKGAFTGAFREKKGRFELAHRGTLFLDEIGELSQDMQVKLLRVLQDGTFERVGGERTRSTDVRLVCATNRDLDKEVAAGRFRADLYYRLSMVVIRVPSLRERPDDIPLLTQHLLRRASEEFDLETPELGPGVAEALAECPWPGNVRQLENCLRHALVKCGGGVLSQEHIPISVRGGGGPRPALAALGRKRKLTVDKVERALRETGGNKVQAALSLGVSRSTLYRFLEKVSSG
jgi:transcriptional regulator with PAS, ATPase and Fis domain